MLRQNVSSKMSKMLNAAMAVSGTLIIVIGGFLRVNATEYNHWPSFQSAVLGLQRSAWWSIAALTVIAGVAQLLKPTIGSSATWRLADLLLTQYRDALFEKKPAMEDPEYFHRVTLFRHCRWRWAFARWPWSGWMVPVARTGHTTHSLIPRFRANANDPDNAEGIAGQTWGQNRMVAVHGLFEIDKLTAPGEVEAYAKRTFVSFDWVDKRRHEHHGRSFLGIPLEVNGAHWGALVVDSRSPDEITTKAALKNPRYKILTEMLSKLLQQ